MSNCKACKKEIYFLTTKKDKMIPINAESLSEQELYDLEHGTKVYYDYSRHVSHFTDCPEALKFRKN